MKNDEQHIHGLLIEKLTGTISEDDDQFLESIITSDPDVKGMYEEMLTFQSKFGETFENNFDHDRSWEGLKQKLQEHEPRKIFNLKVWINIAAILVFVVAISFYFFNTQKIGVSKIAKNNSEELKSVQLQLENGTIVDLSKDQNTLVNGTQIKTDGKYLTYDAKNNNIMQWSKLKVPAKLDYKLKLSDGTEVWLNSASNLRFPLEFNEEHREVYLEGEAYFEVAKDLKKPFIVHTPQTEVKVLGTSFNINAYGEQVSTSLIEGSVLTSSKQSAQTVLLKPGYQVNFTDENGFKQQVFNKEDVTSWMQGVFVFHNISLQDLSEIISRWYGIDVIFDNKSSADLTLSGLLQKNKPLNVFLKHLEETADLKGYYKEGILHIK